MVENRIIEQQGTVNNRTFVLLNFRSIILFSTIFPPFPYISYFSSIINFLRSIINFSLERKNYL